MLQQYQRIMVAVDGSSESELAFKKRSMWPNGTILNWY